MPKKSKKKKSKKIVEQENKMPPVQDPQPEEKKPVTEEEEKNMLIGEIHIELKEPEQKNNSEESKEVTNIKTSPKKKITIKPRESYLKEKISKLNCDERLLTSIQKGLGDQMKTIKNEIKENNVLMTQVPKNLKQFYLKKVETETNLTPNEDYALKRRNKTIKELKDEQDKLKQKLYKFQENENFLENQSFLSLSNSKKNYSIEKSIKNLQKKENKSKINNLKSKISLIDEKMSQLISSEIQLKRKEKLKTFIENFERDKEIAEVRAKKYLKESKERNQRIANDINKLVEKRKKEIDNRSKEAELQKEELIKKFKEQEKAIEIKRSKKVEKKAIACKPYIFEILDKKVNSYLFSQKNKSYQKKEENIIKKEINKRKELMKSVPYEEIKEFAVKIDEQKEKNNLKAEENKKKLNEEWKTRKNSLPPCSRSVEINENENKLEAEESKKEKIENLIKNKKDYSNKIKESKQPMVNEMLKKQRIDKIYELENPKLVKPKINLINYKKKRILLKKRDPSKPSKFKWQLKLEENPNDKLNNSAILNNNLIRKPKNIRLSISFEKNERKRTIPTKKIDYLKDLVAEREEKERANSGNENINNIKWKKAINNKSGSMEENINIVKEKAKCLQNEAEMKQKMLKLNGGIENNPELGKKVSNLLIDSIEAKLSILNQMYKESKND